MAHVVVKYRVYIGTGHHRRPRNAQSWIDVPLSGGDFVAQAGTPITEGAPAFVAIVLPGSTTPVTAGFAFWSRNGASQGSTQTSSQFNEIAGNEDLTLIAWFYLPPTAGDGGIGGGSAELIDAYSVSLGTFVNDDFVSVPSDPTLNVTANVDGAVPTAVAEHVDAFASVASTGESFVEWVCAASDPATVAGEHLSLPAGDGGFAFATYAHRNSVVIVPPRSQYAQEVTIITGIIDDSPGLIWVGGHPVPVDPGWGTLIGRLFTVLRMQHDAGKLSAESATRLRAVTAHEVGVLAHQMNAFGHAGFKSP